MSYPFITAHRNFPEALRLRGFCISGKGGNMFTSPRYATRGVTTTVPLMLQIVLWDLIDSMKVESKDYLQVFRLTTDGKTQHITHTQEQPPYERTLEFSSSEPITAKIFVIDDGTHTTMLLAEEY